MPSLVLATRSSPLALAQCEIVKAELIKHFPDTLSITIRPFQTQVDQNLEASLQKFPEPGIFTKEIQTAVLEKKADVAVHSLKDLPSAPTKGLSLKAVLKRASPYDVLITLSRHPIPLQPPAATAPDAYVIGTSSLRRQLFLKKTFPHFTFKEIRGNLQTRLAKLHSQAYKGLVLAEAGIERLQLHQTKELNELTFTPLPLKSIIPAPAQGAIAVECRPRDRKTIEILQAIHHTETARLVELERRVMRYAGAGCHTPIGIYAEQNGPAIRLRGMVGNIETARIKRLTLYGHEEDQKSLQQMVMKMGRKFKYFLKHHRH